MPGGDFKCFFCDFWFGDLGLDTLLVIFEGIGSRLEILWFFRDTMPGLGDPRLREYTQWVVISLIPRSSKQLLNTRLLICKQLKADTRLAN